MSKIWRWVAPVAVAGGLLAASGAVPAEAASTSTYSVTIGATSNYHVRPYSLVIYKDNSVFKAPHKGLKWDDAIISGKVSGAKPGDVATLYAKRFGAKSFTAQPGRVPLNGTSSQFYKFTVQPTLATKYEVKVTTGTTLDATSSAQAVYVTANGKVTGGSLCSRPVCHEALHIYQLVPGSAFKRESTKKLYFYFGLKLSRTGEPAPPKFLNLDSKATVSKPRRIRAGEWERTITWHFTINNDGYNWGWATCVKDTESKDGMGLPGSHGCGSKRIRSTVTYLG